MRVVLDTNVLIRAFRQNSEDILLSKKCKIPEL